MHGNEGKTKICHRPRETSHGILISYVINMYEFQRSNCTNFHVEMVKVKEGINGWINEKGEGMA